MKQSSCALFRHCQSELNSRTSARSHFRLQTHGDAGDAPSPRVKASQAYCYIRYMTQSLKVVIQFLDLQSLLFVISNIQGRIQDFSYVSKSFFLSGGGPPSLRGGTLCI